MKTIEEHLNEAIDRVTFEMAFNIEQGESIDLGNGFKLYSYFEDDCIVINHEDEELCCVQYNSETKDVEFTMLVEL